jgi:ankyrin repeat protein
VRRPGGRITFPSRQYEDCGHGDLREEVFVPHDETTVIVRTHLEIEAHRSPPRTTWREADDMALSCCAARRNPSHSVVIPKGLPAIDVPSMEALMSEDMRCIALAAFGTARELKEFLDGSSPEERMQKVNAADPASGTTPLLAACRRDHIAGVEVLLACGADASKANHLGWTPLMAATRHAGPKVLGALHAALGTPMEPSSQSALQSASQLAAAVKGRLTGKRASPEPDTA